MTLATLAFALPAYANTDAAACQINGTAATDEVPLTGPSARGSTYSFDPVSGTPLQLTCVAADTTSGEVAVATVTASSSGTYNNIVCGTMTADSASNAVSGTQVLLDSQPPGHLAADLSVAVGSSQYHLLIAGGQGIWVFTSGITGSGTIFFVSHGDEQGNPAPGSAALADATGTGVQPGGRNDCTNHFTLAGAIAAIFPGS